MEETLDEHILKEIVTTSSVKSTGHKSISLCFTILLGSAFLFFALIGIIICALGLYFENLNDDCMNACMNEWHHSEEICRQKYCG